MGHVVQLIFLEAPEKGDEKALRWKMDALTNFVAAKRESESLLVFVGKRGVIVFLEAPEVRDRREHRRCCQTSRMAKPL